MAHAIFDLRFLPPGRGLWAMGTDYVYERGGMALNNCAYVDVTTLSRDAAWIMNGLMAGVGVGFSTMSYTAELRHPQGEWTTYEIPDSREGWVESLRRLIASYESGTNPVGFDYAKIRPAGSPIRGFGGTASGPVPLIQLHERVRGYLDAFVSGRTSRTRLVADVVNAIGACVVAGNVRRSAEIAIGSPHDTEFLNLKNYGTPEAPGPAFDRMDIGWLSNNTARLETHDDFKRLPDLAELIRTNGEPGVMNLINVQKYGR
jgi:ribonucleoside-diphosphate reductase alpha chain